MAETRRIYPVLSNLRVGDAQELYTDKQIEKHFHGRRAWLYGQRKELESMDALLPKMLLAGKITGLELVQVSNMLAEKVLKINARLRISSDDEKTAQQQRRNEGSAYV